MARRPSRSDARRDAAIERERRERARRERERRRGSEAPAANVAPRRAATRAAPAAPARPAAVATAVRERHEGLFGWLARSIAAIPAGIASILRGFALEVVGVFAGIGRFLLALVPGRSRLVGVQRVLAERARDVTASTRPIARGATTRGPAPRTDAERRAADARRSLLRRRLRLVLGSALVVSFLAAWIFVPRSDAFRIRHVEVTGAHAVGDLEVRLLVDRMLRGETVFTLDEAAVERRIEALPFVRTATVQRHLPGGLELRLVEYRPLALGYGSRGFWLVARDGRILAKARRDEWAGRIPIVALRGDDLKPGVRVGDEPALRLLAARTADSSLEFEFVEAERFALVGRLDREDGDVEVRFGRPEQLRQKVLVAERVLREATKADRDLLYIDVSVPSRPAFCFRNVPACHLPRGPEQKAEAAAKAATGDAVEADGTTGEATDDAPDA